MLPLLAIGLLLGSVPGEEDAEPVRWLLTADVGALPRGVLELEAPMTAWGSAFVGLGYPLNPNRVIGRTDGPLFAAGWRVFMFGHGPWGLFLDGRLQADLFFAPETATGATATVIVPGGGVGVGLNAKVWHAVISPGVTLLYLPDPAAASFVLPQLRLAIGGWN